MTPAAEVRPGAGDAGPAGEAAGEGVMRVLLDRAFGRPSRQVNAPPGEVSDRLGVGGAWGPMAFEVPPPTDRRAHLIAIVSLVVALLVVVAIGWFFYAKLTP